MGNPITELLYWYYGGQKRQRPQEPPQETAAIDPRDPRADPRYDGADSLNYTAPNPAYDNLRETIEQAQKLYGRSSFRPAPWRKDPGRLADFEDRRSPLVPPEWQVPEMFKQWGQSQNPLRDQLYWAMEREMAGGNPDAVSFFKQMERSRANGGDVDFYSRPRFFDGGDADGGAGFGSESFGTDSGVAGGFGSDSSEGTASVGGEGPGGDAAATAAAEAAVAEAMSSIGVDADAGEDDGSVTAGQVGTPGMIGAIGPDVLASPDPTQGPNVGPDPANAISPEVSLGLGLMGLPDSLEAFSTDEDTAPAPAPSPGNPSPGVAPGMAGVMGTPGLLGGPTATIGVGPSAFSMEDTLADPPSPTVGYVSSDPAEEDAGFMGTATATSNAEAAQAVADAVAAQEAQAQNAAQAAAMAAEQGDDNDSSIESSVTQTMDAVAAQQAAAAAAMAQAQAQAEAKNADAHAQAMGFANAQAYDAAVQQAMGLMGNPTVAQAMAENTTTDTEEGPQAPTAVEAFMGMPTTSQYGYGTAESRGQAVADAVAAQANSVYGGGPSQVSDSFMGFPAFGMELGLPVDVAFDSDNAPNPGGPSQAGVGGGQDSAAADAAVAAEAAQAAQAANASVAAAMAAEQSGPESGYGPGVAAAQAAEAQAQNAAQAAAYAAEQSTADEDSPTAPSPYGDETNEQFGPPDPNAEAKQAQEQDADSGRGRQSVEDAARSITAEMGRTQSKIGSDPDDEDAPTPSPRSSPVAPVEEEAPAPRSTPNAVQRGLDAATRGLFDAGRNLGLPMTPEALEASRSMMANVGSSFGSAGSPSWPMFGTDDDSPGGGDGGGSPGTLPGGFEPDPRFGFVGIPLPIHGFPNYPPWPAEPVPYGGGGFVEPHGPSAPSMELPPGPDWLISPELRVHGGPEESFPTPGGFSGRDYDNQGRGAVEVGARATWRGNWPDWPWGSKKR